MFLDGKTIPQKDSNLTLTYKFNIIIIRIPTFLWGNIVEWGIICFRTRWNNL